MRPGQVGPGHWGPQAGPQPRLGQVRSARSGQAKSGQVSRSGQASLRPSIFSSFRALARLLRCLGFRLSGLLEFSGSRVFQPLLISS